MNIDNVEKEREREREREDIRIKRLSPLLPNIGGLCIRNTYHIFWIGGIYIYIYIYIYIIR